MTRGGDQLVADRRGGGVDSDWVTMATVMKGESEGPCYGLTVGEADTDRPWLAL